MRWTRRPRLDCAAREGVAGSTKGCGSGRGASSLGDGGVCEELFTIRLQREEPLIALMKSAGEDAGRKVREESERKQKSSTEADRHDAHRKKNVKEREKGRTAKRGNMQENWRFLHGKKRMEKERKGTQREGVATRGAWGCSATTGGWLAIVRVVERQVLKCLKKRIWCRSGGILACSGLLRSTGELQGTHI